MQTPIGTTPDTDESPAGQRRTGERVDGPARAENGTDGEPPSPSGVPAVTTAPAGRQQETGRAPIEALGNTVR